MGEQDVAEARTKAAAHEWTSQRVLRELGTIRHFDFSLCRQCLGWRAELLPGLLQVMQTQTGVARLNASILLLFLEEQAGTDGVVASLREGDERFQLQTLSSLSFIVIAARVIYERPYPAVPQPLPFKQNLLFAELQRFLTNLDQQIGQEALRLIMASLDVSGIDQYFASLLSHDSVG
jgi:hypothetical protein